MNEQAKFIGSLFEKGPGFAGAVWDDEFCCPTLTTMQGGGREPMIIEIIKIGDADDRHSNRWLAGNIKP